MNISFSVKDIKDQEALSMRVVQQASRIMQSANARGSRNMQEILDSCWFGVTPEFYMMEKYGFKDDPHIYRDLLSPQNHRVEIKAVKRSANIPYVMRDCVTKKLSYDLSENVMVFVGWPDTLSYDLQSVWKWDNVKKLYVQSL